MQIEAFQSLNILFRKSYPTLTHRDITSNEDLQEMNFSSNFETLAAGIKDHPTNREVIDE